MRKLILPTILAIVALGILLSLGFWQMQRHEWKQDIIRQAKAGIQAEATDYLDWRKAQTEFKTQFIKVRFSGKLRHEGTVYVHVIRQGRLGYLVLTPVQLPDDSIVFVSRGYVLQNDKGAAKLKDEPEYLNQEAFIRLGELKSYFTPEPSFADRIWYTVDLVSKRKALGASGIIDTHYLELFTMENKPTWPSLRNPVDYVQAIPNRHFEYMLTWFGLAFALICVYLAFVWSITSKDK